MRGGAEREIDREKKKIIITIVNKKKKKKCNNLSAPEYVRRPPEHRGRSENRPSDRRRLRRNTRFPVIPNGMYGKYCMSIPIAAIVRTRQRNNEVLLFITWRLRL